MAGVIGEFDLQKLLTDKIVIIIWIFFCYNSFTLQEKMIFESALSLSNEVFTPIIVDCTDYSVEDALKLVDVIDFKPFPNAKIILCSPVIFRHYFLALTRFFRNCNRSNRLTLSNRPLRYALKVRPLRSSYRLVFIFASITTPMKHKSTLWHC